MPARLEPDPIPRRDFLGLAGTWAAMIAIGGSILGMLRLPKPSVLPEKGSRVRLGRPEDLPAGGAQVVPEHNVLVLADARGVAAVSLVCSHLGCIVKQTEGGFSCPCHGSVFGRQGEVTGGPAPSGLKWLAVSRAVDGRLSVDTEREVPPGTFLEV